MYHDPVMLQEALEGLKLKNDGIVVDVTFGGGGHTKAILQSLSSKSRVLGFDQDPDAAEQAKRIDDERFLLVPSNFRFLERYLKFYKIEKIDGLLADLGVSSHQLDERSRGFSWKAEEADLLMNMNQGGHSAQVILNTYEEKELADVLYLYGEFRNSYRIARAIIEARQKAELKTVGDLMDALKPLAPPKHAAKFYSRIFQAIRIEVNEELEVLKELLEQSVRVLKKGGRLVFISYHSLEDRLVKNFFKAGNFSGEQEKDIYGNVLKPFRELTRKPLIPTEEEVARNPRARSAKMRIAELI